MALEVSGEALWKFLQENDIVVPDDWKTILSATKYDSLHLLANLEESDMKEIRRFMRKDYHSLIDANEVKAVYGVYFKKPENFELTGGQKKSIKGIVQGCTSLLSKLKRKSCGSFEKDPTKMLKTSQTKDKNVDHISAPPNTSSEAQAKIKMELKNILEKNVEGYISATVPELCNADGKITVTAQISHISGTKYMAEIRCPAASNKKSPCEFMGIIHMNKNCNWNTSNFYKHCRLHAKPTDQKSVKDYFSTAKKNQDCLEESDEEITNTVSRKRKNQAVIVDSDEEGNSNPDGDLEPVFEKEVQNREGENSSAKDVPCENSQESDLDFHLRHPPKQKT